MVYKKQFKNENSALYQDHLYEPGSGRSQETNSWSPLDKEKKKGSQFNVISGFVTLFLVGAVIGLVIFDRKFGIDSTPTE